VGNLVELLHQFELTLQFGSDFGVGEDGFIGVRRFASLKNRREFFDDLLVSSFEIGWHPSRSPLEPPDTATSNDAIRPGALRRCVFANRR
jgi:hypothetical protein